MRSIILLANPDSNRAAFFKAAAADAGFTVQIVSWLSLLRSDPDAWRALHEAGGSLVRLESPGRDAEVEKELLRWGHDALAADPGCACWSPEDIDRLLPDKGRIAPMHQWYAGWKQLLGIVRRAAPNARFSHDIDEVLAMFDKAATHRSLTSAGVPVAPSCGVIHHWDALMTAQRDTGWPRLFLKPLHGSSASGIIALEFHLGEMQAFAPVELGDATTTPPALYNCRKVRRYRDPSVMRTIVDALGVSGLHVERWLPKMGLAGKRCDLRVVVIGGRARHVAARLSRHPMTNLHLGGIRGDVEILRSTIGEENWQHAVMVCERAAAAFPRSVSVGVDLLLPPGGSDCRVLEVNAFGGLLPGLLHEGWDTYRWEVEEMMTSE